MSLETQVTRLGESLAIPLPEEIAARAGFSEGDELEFDVQQDGRVLLQRAKPRRFTLEELVASIDPENCHGETDWGPPVGKEVW